MKSSLPYLLLIILCLLTYGNTLFNNYVLDDHAIIVNHQHVQKGFDGIPEILTTNYLNGVQGFNDGLYRPLSPLLFAVQNEINPNDPFIGHFCNLLFAILISIVMYHLLMLVFQASSKIALGLSMVFLVIPIHTEVVANIKSSDELLALLFVLLSVLFFGKYVKENRLSDLIIGGASFFIALFSKESAFVFVLILPMVLYWLNQSKKRQTITVLGITAFLGSCFLLIRNFVLNAMPNKVNEGTLSVLNNSILSTDIYTEKLGTALWMQVLYITKTIIPYSLQHDYSFATIEIISLWSIKGISGVILIVLMGYFTWKFRKTSLLISVGIIWYFGALLIVSNLFFAIGATFAERFVFTPSFGLILVVLGIINYYKVSENISKRTSYLFALVLAVFSLISIHRNFDWKDNFTLYAADYHKLENSARGNYNYGTECKEKSYVSVKPSDKNYYFKQSVTALKRAIEIYPSYWDAYNNLATLYQDNQRFTEAIPVLEKLILEKPSYEKGWYNLGVCYFNMKDYRRAFQTFNSFNDLNSNNANVWYYSGMCKGYQNDFSEAIRLLNKSVLIESNHQDALLMLGKAHGIQGDYVKSKYYLEHLLTINPNHQEALNSLSATNNNIKSQQGVQ
ncbi:tetratricopeptide repeat protein [Aquimarina sp. 2201CG14-23]|uniref:tetratricopeptide repeat protein n=1 Tax=Aquimarina mycalae TaxID=3040073 RepID=UPI0024780236|nr:tetratricopeptide repeat protein [Aquimarina sp. 2201CG14-23]MDH7445159.1 tetratricopeptide repeat protein [Aquimarina sp. 2201CG14-23]